MISKGKGNKKIYIVRVYITILLKFKTYGLKIVIIQSQAIPVLPKNPFVDLVSDFHIKKRFVSWLKNEKKTKS